MKGSKLIPPLDKKDTVVRIAEYSRLHPVIPRLYTQPWMQDMKNRSVLLESAVPARTGTYEDSTPLYLEKREQIRYNTDPREAVDRRYVLPERCRLLWPPIHYRDYKHFSSCIYYNDLPDPRWPRAPRPFDMRKIMQLTADCPPDLKT